MDLSDAELGAIMTTWKPIMKDPEGSGQVVLLRFFGENPQYLDFFEQFKGKPLDEVKLQSKFKMHALKIVQAFDRAIKAIEERGRDAVLSKASWDRLALNHTKRNIPKESFTKLNIVFLQILTEVCPLDEFQRGAWEKLLNYLFGILWNEMVKLEK